MFNHLKEIGITDFKGVSFSGTAQRTPDSGRIGLDLQRYRESTRQERLEELALTDHGMIPYYKIWYGQALLDNRPEIDTRALMVECIERGFDYGAAQYGRTNFNIPQFEYSTPPYASDNQPVGRFSFTGVHVKAPFGEGGIATQFHRVFFSNGQRDEDVATGVTACNIEQLNKVVGEQYPKFVKDLGDCDLGQRHMMFHMPRQENPMHFNKEDRYAPNVYYWVNNCRKRNKPLPEKTVREQRIFRFSSPKGMPYSYDESRGRSADGGKCSNCCTDFEVAFNAYLKRLREEEKLDLTSWNLVLRQDTTISGRDARENQFICCLQLQRDLEVDANGNVIIDPLTNEPKIKEPPEKEVRVVSDVRPYSQIIPNEGTQDWICSPLNSLRRDPLEPNLNWIVRTITWHFILSDDIQYPTSRALQTIILEKPQDENNVKSPNSQFKNVRFLTRGFRGPVNIIDPSQEYPNQRTGEDRYYAGDVTQVEKERHAMHDRNVHELEWMVPGYFIDLLRLHLMGEEKAGMLQRAYNEVFGYPESVQSFMCLLFAWYDMTRTGDSLHLV